MYHLAEALELVLSIESSHYPNLGPLKIMCEARLLEFIYTKINLLKGFLRYYHAAPMP